MYSLTAALRVSLSGKHATAVVAALVAAAACWMVVANMIAVREHRT